MWRKSMRIVPPSRDDWVDENRMTPLPKDESQPPTPVIFAHRGSDFTGDISIRPGAPSVPLYHHFLKSMKHSRLFPSLLVAIALLSFFLDAFRLLVLPQQMDWVVDGSLLLAMGLFCTDMIAQLVTSSAYMGSLGFWLDLWATVGLLADVNAVYQSFVQSCEVSYIHRLRITVRSARLSSVTLSIIRQLNPTQSSQCAQQSRRQSSCEIVSSGNENSSTRYHFDTSELADVRVERSAKEAQKPLTRRLNTFPRLNMMVRIQKKANMKRKARRTQKRESMITSRVTKRLVGITACVGIAVGIFATVAISSEKEDLRFGLTLINSAAGTESAAKLAWAYIDYSRSSQSLVVLSSLSISGQVLWSDTPSSRRSIETCTLTVADVYGEFSTAKQVKLMAAFDLCEASLLTLLFCFACVNMNLLIRRLVLFPLERMLEAAKLLYKDPLHFHKSPFFPRKSLIDFSSVQPVKEINLLETAFRKIGAMLGVVYGTAGREMIANCIALEGPFLAIAPGKQIVAVFCFVKIGNFDQTLQTLGRRIVPFLELVSAYVHNTCERHLGSVNRNLGDSYLLVWKFANEDLLQIGSKLVVNPYSSVARSTVSVALHFAVKTVHKMGRSGELAEYSEEGARGGEKELTFGFHIGWAYEGPIGSVFKIDASYLSPNVNMAARIETAAQQYDVRILVSSDVHSIVDDETQRCLRHIDTVKLKGVKEDVQLFSVDIHPLPCVSLSRPPNSSNTLLKRQQLLSALHDNQADSLSQSALFQCMRSKFPLTFFELYQQALGMYLKGSWEEAYAVLANRCLPLVPFDGPTGTLMKFIGKSGKKAPPDWRGVRELLYK